MHNVIGKEVFYKFVRSIPKKFWIYRGNTLAPYTVRVQKSYILSITVLFYLILNTPEISIFALYTFASEYPVLGIISHFGRLALILPNSFFHCISI